jgi:hypothetical protein
MTPDDPQRADPALTDGSARYECNTRGCDREAVAYWHDAGPFGAGTFYGCVEHAPKDATPLARANISSHLFRPGNTGWRPTDA